MSRNSLDIMDDKCKIDEMIKKLIIPVILCGVLYLLFSSKGLELMQRQIDTYPNAKWAAEAQFKLGSLYFFSLRYNQSLSLYQLLMSKYPDYHGVDEALFRIAECYDELNDTETALVKYREFVALYPNHPWKPKATNTIARITILK